MHSNSICNSILLHVTAAVYDSVTTQVVVGELKLYLLRQALRKLSGPTGKNVQQDPGSSDSSTAQTKSECQSTCKRTACCS